jgi:hypothetical protein
MGIPITKHFMLSLRNNFGPPIVELNSREIMNALPPSFNRFASTLQNTCRKSGKSVSVPQYSYIENDH